MSGVKRLAGSAVLESRFRLYRPDVWFTLSELKAKNISKRKDLFISKPFTIKALSRIFQDYNAWKYYKYYKKK